LEPEGDLEEEEEGMEEALALLLPV